MPRGNCLTYPTARKFTSLWLTSSVVYMTCVKTRVPVNKCFKKHSPGTQVKGPFSGPFVSFRRYIRGVAYGCLLGYEGPEGGGADEFDVVHGGEVVQVVALRPMNRQQ